MYHTAVSGAKGCKSETDHFQNRTDLGEDAGHRASEVRCEDRQRVIAVCGVKNSGKTTLLEKMVRELTKKGVKTAVVKHDGHDFTCDVPDTDSYRMWQAGAYGTAVYSGKRMFVHKEIAGVDETELIRQFPEADIIFLEGLKDSSYPKIEVVRKEISRHPVSNPAGRFLIVTDCREEEIRCAEKREEVSIVGLNDVDEILAKVMEIAGILARM